MTGLLHKARIARIHAREGFSHSDDPVTSVWCRCRPLGAHRDRCSNSRPCALCGEFAECPLVLVPRIRSQRRNAPRIRV